MTKKQTGSHFIIRSGEYEILTKEWQKQLSDAPENARTLAHETSIRYRAEQNRNPVPEEFERKLEFHDAQITSAVMEENDLHLYFDHPGYNPFEHNHIVFKNARIKTKELVRAVRGWGDHRARQRLEVPLPLLQKRGR